MQLLKLGNLSRYCAQDGMEIVDKERNKNRDDYPDLEANQYNFDDEVKPCRQDKT